MPKTKKSENLVQRVQKMMEGGVKGKYMVWRRQNISDKDFYSDLRPEASKRIKMNILVERVGKTHLYTTELQPKVSQNVLFCDGFNYSYEVHNNIHREYVR